MTQKRKHQPSRQETTIVKASGHVFQISELHKMIQHFLPLCERAMFVQCQRGRVLSLVNTMLYLPSLAKLKVIPSILKNQNRLEFKMCDLQEDETYTKCFEFLTKLTYFHVQTICIEGVTWLFQDASCLSQNALRALREFLLVILYNKKQLQYEAKKDASCWHTMTQNEVCALRRSFFRLLVFPPDFD